MVTSVLITVLENGSAVAGSVDSGTTDLEGPNSDLQASVVDG